MSPKLEAIIMYAHLVVVVVVEVVVVVVVEVVVVDVINTSKSIPLRIDIHDQL